MGDPQVCRSEVGRLYQSQCCASQQGLRRQFFKMAKFFLLASLAITSVVSQDSFASANQASRPGGYVHNPAGDAGEAYVHDTTGDHGPYYYWKLRQQGKSGVAAPARAPAPAPAPQRQVVTVRRQRPAPQPAFNNFQARPAVQAAPARQQYFQPAPAQPVAPAQNFFQPQAPEYTNNYAQRAYAYTAPTYSAQAQGSSFSYEAQF